MTIAGAADCMQANEAADGLNLFTTDDAAVKLCVGAGRDGSPSITRTGCDVVSSRSVTPRAIDDVMGDLRFVAHETDLRNFCGRVHELIGKPMRDRAMEPRCSRR